MRGRAVLGLSGVVVAGGASAAILLSGAAGVRHALLSDLPFGIGGGGTPGSVAAQGGSAAPGTHGAARPRAATPPFLPPLVSTIAPIGPSNASSGVPVDVGVGTAPTSQSPTPPSVGREPKPPTPTPPPSVPPPTTTPPPTQPPAQPTTPPTTPPGGSTTSPGSTGSSGGSSEPPPPPPPPADAPCSVGVGILTISNSTAHASAVVQGCSKTDLRLTLAAYRRGGTSFQLLASATLYPVSDGTASQVLQLPSCSTDVVLIRGSAPATVSSFSVVLARTTAPGCGGTDPSQGGGTPPTPSRPGDGSPDGDSADADEGSHSSDASTDNDGSAGDEATGEPGSPEQTGAGDSGSSQQSDGGSTSHDSAGGDSASTSGTTAQGAPRSGDGRAGGATLAPPTATNRTH